MNEEKISKKIGFRLRLFVNNLRSNFVMIFLDFVTMLGSIVTIYTSYFDGDIDLNKIQDLFILFFLIFVFSVFMYKIICNFNYERIILKKRTFFDYVNRKLLYASRVINLAGDLSWLEKQQETFKELRSKGCSVKIYYCDSMQTQSDNIARLILEYKQIGIEMIPYPLEMESHHTLLKGLIIDNGEGNLKFYSFTKEDDDGSYMKCSLYKNSDPELKMIQAYVNSLDELIEIKNNKKILQTTVNTINKSLLIGVSGLNNIGKSSLCRLLIKDFGEEAIEVIPDTFIQHSGASDFEISLFCISIQLTIFNRVKINNPNKKIFIFDRTPIDNFAFLLVHLNQLKKKNSAKKSIKKYPDIKYPHIWDEYVAKLETELEMFMKNFDLIALLIPEKKQDWINPNSKTSAVSNEIRASVLKEIDRLYKKLVFLKIKKYLVNRFDSDDLEQDDIDKKVEERISVIVDEIKSNISKR